MKRCDLQTGSRFGRLTTTGDVERRGAHLYEKCLCDCGNVKWIPRCNLVLGKAKSCGCLQKDNCRTIQEKYFKKHGMARTRIYSIFQGMKMRTENKNHISYKYYGGKGIKCLWDSFDEFYRDMGESYEIHVNQFGEKNTTIDRINRDGDYCKENCKRSNRKEQMYNRDIVDVYGFNYTNMVKDEGKKSD